MSTLVAITALAETRPTPDAPVQAVAAWYERKAVLLHEIADTDCDMSERDTFERLATQAHQHAVRLLTDVTGGVSR